MLAIPTGNEQRRSLKLGKCWQGTKPLIIFQVNPWGFQKSDLPKKLYLIIECQQAKRGVFLRTQKPSQIKVGGGISSLLRKCIPTGTVRDIFVGKENKEIWIPIYRGGVDSPEWYLLLSNGKPPELSFLSAENITLFRFGQKGTFTKRKDSAHTLPPNFEADHFESMFDSLFKECIQVQSLDASKDKEPSETFVSEAASDLSRDAKHKLIRRIKTIKKSLEKQKKTFPSETELEILSKKATFLQSYAYLTKPQQTCLILDTAMTGLAVPLEIELEPEWSIGKNVEEYFIRLKKRKRSAEIGAKMLAKISKELTNMEADLEQVKKAEIDDTEIHKILRKYKIDVLEKSPNYSNSKVGESVPYRIFKGPNNVEYFVGKGPSENDILTKKAKSNDFWFHLIGGGGSHVVVPRRSLGKEGLSPEVKREAAILAVHFSKVRQDRAGEVYVTERRHLRKQKGLPVGLWLVDQSETLFLKYAEKDLKLILER